MDFYELQGYDLKGGYLMDIDLVNKILTHSLRKPRWEGSAESPGTQ